MRRACARGVPARLVIALAATMTFAACGAAEGGEGEPTGPTVADSRFGGRFELVEADIDSDIDDLDALAGVVFEFDSEFGALSIETPCGELLGSFSLLDDGRAGVSVTGGRSTECSDDETDATNALIGALGRIETWADAGPGFELRSAEERDLLRLAP